MSETFYTPGYSIVVEVGAQGPSGPPGQENGNNSGTVSHWFDGHRVVAINADGQLEYADHRNLDHVGAVVGISSHGGMSGTKIPYITSGPLSSSAWVWTPQRFVFLGIDGYMTQTPPTTGFLQPIGRAISPNTVLINIQIPTIRSQS